MEIQEREAINAFIKSYPPELQYELRKGDFKTTDEVCSMAEKLQDIKRQINSMQMAAVQTNVAAGQGNMAAELPDSMEILALKKKVENLELEAKERKFRGPAEGGPSNIECWECKGLGHVQRNCPRRQSARNIRCRYCNRMGHRQENCWSARQQSEN